MKNKIAKKLKQRKRKILNRLDKRSVPEHPGPMLNPGNIHYGMADRTRGIAYGGMGAMHLFGHRKGGGHGKGSGGGCCGGGGHKRAKDNRGDEQPKAERETSA